MVKRFIILATLLILAVNSGASENKYNPTPWAFEFSAIYSFSDLDLADVRDELKWNIDQSEGYGNSLENIERFDLARMVDLKLSLRYRRLLVGINFSNTYATNGGFNYSGYDTTNGWHWQGDFNFSVSTKEYVVQLGYFQPILPRLELGLVGSYGIGAAKASLLINSTSEDSVNTYTYKYDHPLEGSYKPIRIEGHIRFNFTEFIMLDLSAGYRIGKPPEMRGDVHTTFNGQDQAPAINVTEIHHTSEGNEEELLFNYSGMFYGAGITLRNPL